MRKILLFVNFISIIALNVTFAGVTGKLAGKVVDVKSNEAIPFANVTIVGTSLGAATDVNGNYVILNISPGRYSVKAQSVGYQPQIMENIAISIDLTTKLDFSLGESSIELKAIVVQGAQDVLKKDVTSSQSSITAVIGESSGAGYPFTPLGTFSRYIQQRLSLVYPNSTIEVINCSMTAINTYTLRDLFPGILDMKPDLVLVYTGHNEYYGALGVGSNESLGTSRGLVNFVIYLEQFKTIQFLRNIMKGVAGFFGGKQEPASGTLMSRMARDQYIGFSSDAYKKGIDQFEGNMHDILEMAKQKNLPVILGNLACNLKDQSPFVSINEKGFPRADIVFKQAKESLAEKNNHKADSLFRLAKDLDALRFRAPTEINNIISALGKEFNYPVVNIDSVFNSLSPDHITGDNLMTDHLHPTLNGYQIIGDLFCREMELYKILPSSKPLPLNDWQQDSITVAHFSFSRIDSVIGEYRIKFLKNDWPYIDKSKKINLDVLLNPVNRIDSLALDVVYDKITWDLAHRKAAEWYLSKGDHKLFISVMDALISQYPIVVSYYDYTSNILLKLKDYDDAYYFLLKRNAYEPSAFSCKWLGIVDLYKNRIASSQRYLNQSINFDDHDPQVWYNLAGTYVNENNYQKAFDMVNKAIQLSPDYPDAMALRNQLQQALKSN